MPASRGRTRCQSVPGMVGRVDVAERQRTERAPGAGGDPAGDAGRRVAGERALEQQRLHTRTPAHREQRPRRAGGLDQCSTGQPRLRAMVASLASGFTATG